MSGTSLVNPAPDADPIVTATAAIASPVRIRTQQHQSRPLGAVNSIEFAWNTRESQHFNGLKRINRTG
jgi:hypothetical protein